MTIEFHVIRDTFKKASADAEGFTLGGLYLNKELVCFTLEDEDRQLENGNKKVFGLTCIPTGRYELVPYSSPKHGAVLLFKDVPGFSYVEIHKANNAIELLGCVAVGMQRTFNGVRECQPAMNKILKIASDALNNGEKIFCTVERHE